MFRNLLKTAFRNLWRHKAFSFINIMGLTIGMTACFLIFLFVKFELSYENFHPKADRIYKIAADIKTPTEVIHAGGPSFAVPPNLKTEFPEVEEFARVLNTPMIVRYGEIKFKEDNILVVDSAAFRIFGWQLLKGDPNTALAAPFSAVLTETAAKKYFGNEDPMGKTLLLGDQARPNIVTGVMKDLPENTQINSPMIFSMSSLTAELNPNLDKQWGNYGADAYILLKTGTTGADLEKKLPDFLKRMNGEEMDKWKMWVTLFLKPVRDVYLYSDRNDGKSGKINNVYIFSIVAIFILVIACINFVNLTTARSTERAKEVGIRKVAGAGKYQLIRQFIGESLIISLIAFGLALLLTMLLLPMFNNLAGKTISTGVFSNWQYPAWLFVASVGIGLLAGFYPALVLARFRPIVVLKGRFATGTKGILLRKGLVVAQFTISIALIIATLVVYFQTSYMRNQDLGFKKDQMLVIRTEATKTQKTFKEEIRKIPGVKSVSLGSSVPGNGWNGAYSEIENTSGEYQVANLNLIFVDFDYMPQLEIQMVAGRQFSRDFLTDTTKAMVINESAVKMFGYSDPKQAIGKKYKQWGSEGQIIGVMKDFNYNGLQEEIKPLTLRMAESGNGGYDHLTVNVAGGQIPVTIAAIKKKWKEMVPNLPFSYTFIDEIFDHKYRDEQRFGELFLNFAALAILISCLGLLGLTAYSTMQRTKEIGIRKVMGASVSNILHLLSKEFIWLAGISFVVSAPLAWFFMHKWLQNFAYRINITWSVFAIAGTAALLIGLFTISFQAVKAAIANPVKALRTE
ncbi:ABC transporter permease [Pseudobacter ginsenosidimutans]|uniref:Putative ABC transport system permease protein n=1 Tax=Pseudobacter ginsenosidimutans TaxID=661488 RepID=A0A4Q7N5Z2_9BACT|nr:ABC transporter permease [Pseudobacter ginsenosidimutans]QEC44988.1 FtsX-like permease family protein [Pseudobacter ginsenosidimutans]RZS76482.1 putative ABC transport system permease protein [Pseudobacter ginsenosidimutans]